jgi:hypothetical protein
MDALTIVLHSSGDEASEWPQLYQQDPNFATTYYLLGIGVTITNFHIQDKLLCHLGHLCVPTRKHENIIWEANYNRVAGHFRVEKTVVILQKKILAKNLTQRQPVYHIFHCMCHFQANYQESRPIHPSSYS